MTIALETMNTAQRNVFAGAGESAGLLPGFRLYNPKGLRRFKAALDGALFSPVHIHVYGDSIDDGVGTTGSATANTDNAVADQKGYPGQLRSRLAAMYGKPEAGSVTFRNGATSEVDARIVRNGGASASTTGPMWTGWSFNATNGSGGTPGTATITVPSSTAFDLLIYQASAGNFNGAFTYAVDGGSAVTVPAGTAGFTTINVTGLSQAPHTIVITGTSAAPAVATLFVLRYHSGAGVSVCRFTRAGWTLLDSFGLGSNNNSFGNAAALDRLAQGYGAWSPNLTVIGFLHNDWAGQLTANPSGIFSTPDNYETYMRNAVGRCVATGGSVLLRAPQEPPTQTVPGGQPLSVYRNVMKKIALDTDHVACIDMNERVGSVAEAIAAGFYFNSTTVHPSVKGYGVMATTILDALTRPSIVGPAA